MERLYWRFKDVNGALGWATSPGPFDDPKSMYKTYGCCLDIEIDSFINNGGVNYDKGVAHWYNGIIAWRKWAQPVAGTYWGSELNGQTWNQIQERYQRNQNSKSKTHYGFVHWRFFDYEKFVGQAVPIKQPSDAPQLLCKYHEPIVIKDIYGVQITDKVGPGDAPKQERYENMKDRLIKRARRNLRNIPICSYSGNLVDLVLVPRIDGENWAATLHCTYCDARRR